MRRPFRLRSLVAVVAVGVVAVGLVVLWRAGSRDRSRLEAVFASQAAEGLGTSLRDLVLTAPPLDRDAQERAREWMRSGGAATDRLFAAPALLTSTLVLPLAPSPRFLEAHEGFRAEADALAALLASGRLCLTSLGWLPWTPEEADDLTLDQRAGLPIPNLVRARAAARWFADEAALAEDPEPALEALDRLGAAMDRPGVLIDAMIAMALDAERDQALVALVLLGRLSPGRRVAWLDESPRAVRLLADAWRGERLVCASPLARDLLQGRSLAAAFGGTARVHDVDDVWRWHLRPILVDPAEDAATFLDGMLALERHLRGTLGAEAAGAALRRAEDLEEPFALMVPNAAAVLASAGGTETRSRAARAAAALAVACRERGSRPRDGAEARAWLGPRVALLSASRFGPALTVGVTPEGRLRISPDPTTPTPALLDPAAFRSLEAPPKEAWPSDRVFSCRGTAVEMRLP